MCGQYVTSFRNYPVRRTEERGGSCLPVVYTNGANVFSVVFTPPPPRHHGCIWLLPVISYSLLTLPIYMIGEVSWEPKRRRAGASQYFIPRWSVLLVKRDTPPCTCTSILLVVEGIHPARQYCWWWKGYTMHFNTAGDRNGYTLQVHSSVSCGKGYTLHAQNSDMERDTPCTPIHGCC